MELQDLFRALQLRNIRYLLCGGLAVNIYGIPRSTADVDIVLDFETENVTAFLNTIKILSFTSTLPLSFEVLIDLEERQKLIQQRNLIAYSFFNSERNVFSLDVLVKVPISFEEMWERRETRKFGNAKIQMVSMEDLILMKQATDRTQDKEDVILLIGLTNKNNDKK